MRPSVFAATALLLIAGSALALPRQRAGCASCNKARVVQQRANVVVQQAAQQVVQRQVVRQQVVQQVIKKEVVAAAIVPVAQFVQVPLYTAVYQQAGLAGGAAGYSATAGAAAPAGAAASEMQQVLGALRQLDQRLQILEGRAAPPPPAKEKDRDKEVEKKGEERTGTPASRMLTLVSRRCARCHDATVSEEKGSGFTLVKDEALVVPSDRQARKLLTMTYSGKMPPRDSGQPALTDAEVGTVVSYVDSLK